MTRCSRPRRCTGSRSSARQRIECRTMSAPVDPDVPWRAIVDFRNLLAHGYEYVLLDRVWQVIVADLPPLEAQLRAILDELR